MCVPGCLPPYSVAPAPDWPPHFQTAARLLIGNPYIWYRWQILSKVRDCASLSLLPAPVPGGALQRPVPGGAPHLCLSRLYCRGPSPGFWQPGLPEAAPEPVAKGASATAPSGSICISAPPGSALVPALPGSVRVSVPADSGPVPARVGLVPAACRV